VNGTAKAESDLDIAVRVAEGSRTSYWDWPEMMEELKGIFSAEIDLISEGGINNPYFRAEFERTRRVLYGDR
jgi:predicted nucleotidyltransferase